MTPKSNQNGEAEPLLFQSQSHEVRGQSTSGTVEYATWIKIVTTFWFAGSFIVAHLPIFIFTLPFALVGNQTVTRRALYVAHRLFRFLISPFISVSYVNAPKSTKGTVFVSNHVSIFDPFWFDGAFSSEMTFIAASFVFDIPLFGWWLRRAGAIPIKFMPGNRQEDTSTVKESARACVQAADNWLAQGRDHSLALFPEGARSKSGELRPFKPTAFKLAIHHRKALQACVLLGSREVAPVGAALISPSHVTVVFSDPVDTTHLPDDSAAAVEQLCTHTYQWMNLQMRGNMAAKMIGGAIAA